MIGLDTNILLRLYVDDPTAPEQVRAARSLLARQEKDSVWLSLPVVLETIWLLQRQLSRRKGVLLGILADLLDRPVFVLQERAAIERAMQLFTSQRLGFVDCLIEALAGAAGVSHTYTFDRDAMTIDHFISPESKV